MLPLAFGDKLSPDGLLPDGLLGSSQNQNADVCPPSIWLSHMVWGGDWGREDELCVHYSR